VRPTVEEVQAFATYMSKDNKQDDSSAGEGMNGEELIKRTFLGVN
jgi:hypothetical protein